MRHSVSLSISRVTLYTAGHLHTAVPHCSHSRAPGEQWARLCVFTLQGCVQAARLCRAPVYIDALDLITIHVTLKALTHCGLVALRHQAIIWANVDFIFSKIQWHSSKGIIIWRSEVINSRTRLPGNCIFKIMSSHPKGQCMKGVCYGEIARPKNWLFLVSVFSYFSY